MQPELLQPEFVQYLVGQGGLAIVAIFAIWVLRDTYEGRLEDHRDEQKRQGEYYRRQEQLLERMADALEKNTQALSYVIGRTTEADSTQRRDLE